MLCLHSASARIEHVFQPVEQQTRLGHRRAVDFMRILFVFPWMDEKAVYRSNLHLPRERMRPAWTRKSTIDATDAQPYKYRILMRLHIRIPSAARAYNGNESGTGDGIVYSLPSFVRADHEIGNLLALCQFEDSASPVG